MDVMGIYRRVMFMYIRRVLKILILQYVSPDFLLIGMGSKLVLRVSLVQY